MVLKTDLVALKAEIAQDTQTTVRNAKDLYSRVHALEAKPSGSGGSESKEAQEMASMLNQLDPALKWVAFIGWPAEVEVGTRIVQMETWMKETNPTVRYATSDNFYTGPYNGRKPNKASYVDLFSSRRFYDNMKTTKQSKVSLHGHKLTIKIARTKLAGARNHNIRKAEELIKASTKSIGQSVNLDFKEREIKVGSALAFKQEKHEINGAFMGAFTDLQLP
jgi:hypothetical protein